MRGSRLVGGVLAVGVAAAVYLGWPREQPSPEDEIRALVAEAVAAAERRDVGALVALVADDFQGPSGASKQELRQVLLGQLLRGSGQVVVLNPALEVSVPAPGQGAFTGTFLFARDGQGAAEASRYEIDAALAHTGDGWRVTRATWSR